MHEDLLTFIINNREYNIQEKKSIEVFMNQIDIWEDISYDAIKKASYRLRNFRKIPHFRTPRRISS